VKFRTKKIWLPPRPPTAIAIRSSPFGVSMKVCKMCGGSKCKVGSLLFVGFLFEFMKKHWFRFLKYFRMRGVLVAVLWKKCKVVLWWVIIIFSKNWKP
jgi:hypothetical protein